MMAKVALVCVLVVYSIIIGRDVGVHGVIVDAPTIILTEGLGARVLRVRWTLVNSDASNPVSGYRIKAGTSTNEMSVAFVEEVGPNQTLFIFHGLSPYEYRGTPGVTYNVSVAAFNDDGDGPPSDLHPVLLPPCPGSCDYQFYRNVTGGGPSGDQDPHPCGGCACNFAFEGPMCSTPTFKPQDVTASTYVSGNSLYLNVTWEAPPIQLLDGRLLESFCLTIFNIDTPSETTVLQSNFSGYTEPLAYYQTAAIAEGRTYQVSVETITDVDGDTASVTIRKDVPLQPPGPVQNLIAASVSATSITLQWTAPLYKASSITEYRVEYRVQSESLIMNATITDVGQTAFTVTDLTPGTRYQLRVIPVNSLGDGPQTVISALSDCGIGTFLNSSLGECVECPPLLSTNSTGASECDICRYSLQTVADQGACYYFETTPNITDPTSSDATVDDISNSVSLNLRWTIHSFVFSFDDSDTALAAVTGYVVHCTVVRGLIPSDVNHTQEVDVVGFSNNVVTFPSLLPLVEYSFTVSIRAGPYQQHPVVDGRQSQPVNFITPATASARAALPRITEVVAAGSNQATVTFELINNIKPLISMLTLAYGQFLDSNALSFTTPIPPESIPEDGPGNITATQLDSDISYQFKLLTVIGRYYTYESAVVHLDASTETMTTSDVTTGTTDAVNDNDTTTLRVTGTTTAPPGPTTPGRPTTPEIPISPSRSTTPGTTAGPTTSNTSAPTIIQVVATTFESIMVTWSKLDGASGYVVRYFDESGDLDNFKSVVGASVVVANISGLRAYTNYTVQVAAVDDQGREGPLSQPVSVFTPEAAPGPPTNVEVARIAERGQLTVTWEPPTNPNGVIQNYSVIIMFENGSSISYTVDAATLFVSIDEPEGPYSVTVVAINGAGEGQVGTPTINETTTVGESPSSAALPDWLIPVVAGGGGVLLLLLLLICLVCCCCFGCVAYRRKKTGGAAFVKEYNYEYHSGEEFGSYNAQMTAKRWMKHNLHGNKSTSEANIFLPPHMYTDGVVESNMNAVAGGGEMYAEVDDMQKMRVEASLINSQTQEVIKDASPEDYNNEELYQVMEKIYYVDVEKTRSLDAFEADRSIIELKEEIGHGEFGRVMKATAKGVIPGKVESTVAVKMLKEGASDTIKKDFLGEAHMLAKFSHPNVLGLLKVVMRTEPILVVLPYMTNGDLKGFLRRQKKRLSLVGAPAANGEDGFGVLQQLEIGEQVAAGMEYLAAKYFIHRDLAARNVLVGDGISVKISDFGLSRSLAKENAYYHLTQTKKLPVKWMALESLLYRKFSTYGDVWSFGVVLWEIFSFGASPYPGVSAVDICDHVQRGNRMQCPKGCPQQTYEMMEQCWRKVKEERPTFTELKIKLKAARLALRKRQRLGSEANDKQDEANYINDGMGPDNDQ